LNDLAVLGAGLVSPAGCTVDTLWQAAVEGSSFAEPWGFPQLDGWRTLVCRASRFDPADRLQPHEIRRLDRAHQMAFAAADDALAGVELPEHSRCAVVVGMG
jgi:3-oxoacyl-(acyl-carrier-protein) synthase